MYRGTCKFHQALQPQFKQKKETNRGFQLLYSSRWPKRCKSPAKNAKSHALEILCFVSIFWYQPVQFLVVVVLFWWAIASVHQPQGSVIECWIGFSIFYIAFLAFWYATNLPFPGLLESTECQEHTPLKKILEMMGVEPTSLSAIKLDWPTWPTALFKLNFRLKKSSCQK